MALPWFSRLRDRLRGNRPDAAAVRAAEEQLARGEALLADGRRAEAMIEFLAAFSREPTLVDHFAGQLDPIAREIGGEIWLEYRLVGLRAALEAARSDGGLGGAAGGSRSSAADPDELAELLRESYVELLEEHRGSEQAMVRIRGVGRLIDEATSRGELPRAMMRRARRE